MAGSRRGKGLVHAAEVAAGLSPAAFRAGTRPAPAGTLSEPRLLKPAKLRALVETLARAEGFDVVGVTTPDAVPEAAPRLKAAIEAGHHGTMEWLASTVDRRGRPKTLWPAVRSIVMLGMNYGPEGDPLATLADRQAGTISVYARNRDYHNLIKGALKRIATPFAARAGADVKVFVDTAPIMEKPLAKAAGLGWQGKHTNLVSRELGSWLFLGAIFTTAELEPDAPEHDHCGSCRACLDVCPTDAFPAPYRLDARRCISYLTIEHDGPIPRELRPLMGNRIYGCDDCLAVCPWNKFAAAASQMKLQARPDLQAPRLAELAGLDDAGFRAVFSGSAIKRIGRGRFVRNVLIAIGNSSDSGLADHAVRLLDDADPQVRGAAVWALARLRPQSAAAMRTARLAEEREPQVRDEWEEAAAQARA
jgi:epoxyqueuosine reductase